MVDKPKVFMPRLMDRDNFNAQNINAKILLPYLSWQIEITTLCYGVVDENLSRCCKIIKLWRGRLFQFHILFHYLLPYDIIFYPGHEWFDAWGLKLRKLLRIPGTIVSTLEGIPHLTNPRKSDFEALVGHEVHCMSFESSKYYLQVLAMADHVIAISPFLAKVGSHLYGDKFSVIPLGVDTQVFYPPAGPRKPGRVRVVSAGTVYPLKRPELFLALAEAIPDADFRWYGGSRGDLLNHLKSEQQKRGINNLEFVGEVTPEELADAFRKADLFVLPSKTEGVPKVSQEAAACRLPLVLFGHYEAPTVVHGENGVVVWDDDELVKTVADLAADREKLAAMGKRSSEMAKEWDWGILAPKWQNEIVRLIGGRRALRVKKAVKRLLRSIGCLKGNPLQSGGYINHQVFEEKINEYRRRGASIGERVRLIGQIDGINPHLVTIGDYSIVGLHSALLTHCPVKGAQTCRVGRFVYIGYSVSVLPGVTIGDYCIIGAGSVVTKDVPENSIVAGNPARVLRQIKNEEKQSLVNAMLESRKIGFDSSASS